MKISPREFARLKGKTLNGVYAQLWAGRIPGATQDASGRWRIPVESRAQNPQPDYKACAAHDDSE